MKQITFNLLMVILFAGCASTPATIHYYLLPVATEGNGVVAQSAPSLLIEHVELADYLAQPGLVLQTSSNKIHISKSHLWAERLEIALPKVLQIAMYRQSDQFAYYLNHQTRALQPDFRVRLRVDALHPTNSGVVIASGHHQMTSAKKPENTLVKYFYFEQALDDDGHEEAVKKINLLVNQIAQDILHSMRDQLL